MSNTTGLTNARSLDRQRSTARLLWLSDDEKSLIVDLLRSHPQYQEWQHEIEAMMPAFETGEESEDD